MTKHLFLLAAVGFALSAEAAKVDYHFNNEYRVRGQFNRYPEGTRYPSNTDGLEHRLKLGGGAKISERFSFNGVLLHNATWGSEDTRITGSATATGDTRPDQHNGVATYDNMILVQEAHGSWILNESTSLRFGRSAITFGDGTVMGANDYLRTPSSFDGAVLNYEMDAARFQAWGARLSNYSRSPGASGANDPNPQANSLGVSVDFKRLPPFLKLANIHGMRNTKATTPLAAYDKARFGQNGYRYGAAVGGDFKAFDYRVSYAGISTNYYDQTVVNGPTTKLSGDAWMLDVEAGFRLAVMDSRAFLRYHTDSGDGTTGTVRGATYDPFFYEEHGNAGQMDLVRWGNLSYYGAGFTMKPMDQLTLGIEGYIFKKSQQQDNVYAGFNGGDLFPYIQQNGWTKNSSNIGTEIDVYAEKVYDGGFSVLGRLGHFMPSDYLKDNARPEPISQAFLQGKMVF